MTGSPDPVGPAFDPADPGFQARLWRFLDDEEYREALSPDSPDCYLFACALAGMFVGMTAQFQMLARGMTLDQGSQAVAELIRDQRALYESLAAPSPQPAVTPRRP